MSSDDQAQEEEAVIQEREAAAVPDVEPSEPEGEGLEEETEDEVEEKESEKIEDRLDEKLSGGAAKRGRRSTKGKPSKKKAAPRGASSKRRGRRPKPKRR